MPDGPRIAHIGIAVHSIRDALAFYRDVLGVEPDGSATSDGASIVSLPFGGPLVELLEPLDAGGPIARFLERRGPGIHHVCYEVTDLDAALAAARRGGYRLVDEEPRRGAHGRRIAFLHPKGTGGILIELTEAAP